MIRYVFKDDPLRIKASGEADPQRIGETLANIQAAHSGRLSPEDVVQEAADPDNPLHPHFEWDDAAAAHKYRLDQAREIIRITHVDTGEGNSERAFHSIKDPSGGGFAYRSSDEVKSSTQLQLALLQQAERDLEAFERRYRELSDVCDAVRVARQKVAQKRRQTEPETEAA